jgi:hypothetical protein
MKTATIPELARELGVTRQSLESFRDANGVKPMGKKGAADLFYKSDFSTFGKSKKEKSEWQLLWEKERALKLQIENERKRGLLLERDLVASVFGKIYGAHRSIFLNMGPALAGIIAAKTGIKKAEIKIGIEEIITGECYQALTTIKQDIDGFLKKIEVPALPDTDNGVQTRKRKTARTRKP